MGKEHGGSYSVNVHSKNGEQVIFQAQIEHRKNIYLFSVFVVCVCVRKIYIDYKSGSATIF